MSGPALTPSEAVEELARLGVPRSERTLANYRTAGGGPAYVRDGIRPRYTLAELRRWAAEQLGAPAANTTSERQAGRELPDMAAAHAARPRTAKEGDR